MSSQLFSRAVLNAAFSVDDHSDGSMIIRASDGKLLVAASTHSAGNNNYWLSLSNNPLDPSSFAAPVNIGSQLTGAGSITSFAYANLVQLPGESNKLFNFYRAQYTATPDLSTHYSTSTDGGVTWTQGQRLLWTGRPYFRCIQNGGSRIDMLISTGNPSDGIFSYINIYHMYYQGGHFFDSLGNDLGSPPFTETQPTKIYDSQASGLLAWHWDLKIDPTNGRPVVAFVTFPTQTDHRYQQARFNGSSWSYTEICAAGSTLYNAGSPAPAEPHYSGGFCMDPLDMNTVYASRQVDGSGNISTSGVHQLFKFTTSDNNVSWQNQGQLTSDSYPSFRPRIILGSRKLMFANGYYNAYSGIGNYLTNIKNIDISSQLVGSDGASLVGADRFQLIGNT